MKIDADLNTVGKAVVTIKIPFEIDLANYSSEDVSTIEQAAEWERVALEEGEISIDEFFEGKPEATIEVELVTE